MLALQNVHRSRYKRGHNTGRGEFVRAAPDLKGGLDRRRLAAAERLHIAAAACMAGGSPAISRRTHANLAGQLQGGFRALTSVKPPSGAQPEELLLIAHVACVQGKCLKSATYVVVNPCDGPIASMLFQVSRLMSLQSDDPRYRPTLPEQVSSTGLRGIYRHLISCIGRSAAWFIGSRSVSLRQGTSEQCQAGTVLQATGFPPCSAAQGGANAESEPARIASGVFVASLIVVSAATVVALLVRKRRRGRNLKSC